MSVDLSRDRSRGNSGPLEDVGNRVKFSEELDVKVMTPVSVEEFSALDRPPSPASAVSFASSVSSEVSPAPIAKVLAKRLSFWNRPSKASDDRNSNVEATAKEDARPLDSLIHEDMPEPQDVLNRIVDTAAPPPATMREKYTELEAKILRQTVKEFAKGEIYFAYDFGIVLHIHCGNSANYVGPRHNAYPATQARADCQDPETERSARRARCPGSIGPVRSQWRGH